MTLNEDDQEMAESDHEAESPSESPDSGPPGTFAGYYDRIFRGGSALTRWAHHARRDAVLKLIGDQVFESAADVGCADGWLLRDLYDHGVIKGGVGIDNEPEMLEAGRTRSTAQPELFFTTPEDENLSQGSFDLVCCLETLEHVEDVDAVVRQIAGLVRSGGIVVVSVPIEVGPALFVKQTGRWWANRLTDYGYERYSWQELQQAGLRWDASKLTRTNIYSHKGFDYREVRAMLSGRFELVRSVYSPLPWTGPWGASTVFWMLRNPMSHGNN
jgi:SAM-dependent methyltransferase